MILDAASLFSLRGRTALLTGAGGFLGRTMARALLANGASLVAMGRSERLLTQVSAWETEFGPGSARAVQVDMYDLEKLAEALDGVVQSGPIDILVNNAHELGPGTGFNVPEGNLETAPLEQWHRHLMAGVYWPALTIQKLGPAMKHAGRGNIINVSTMYSLVAPNPELYEGTHFVNPPGYSAAKAALNALTRYAASYWGPFGIRANAIAPGPFSNTEDASGNSVSTDDVFVNRLRARTCLHRIGRPGELAGALLFLASDASSYVTGQVLTVDGGWTVT